MNPFPGLQISHSIFTSMVWVQVMASKTKVYFVLEYASGGELLKKIVSLVVLPLIFKENSVAKPRSTNFQWDLSCDLIGCELISCDDDPQKHGAKLSEDEARRFFQQLVHAMDYCHAIGVYHRDLKVNTGKKLINMLQ